MDVGRGILRRHRLPLATRYGRAAAARPRPHRLCRGALETTKRIRDACPRIDPSRRARARSPLCGAHHRCRQPRVAARDHHKWRDNRRALSQTSSIWRRGEVALSHLLLITSAPLLGAALEVVEWFAPTVSPPSPSLFATLKLRSRSINGFLA